MEVREFEGKELESVIEKAIEELKITKEEAIITNEEVSKGSLIKKKNVKVKIYLYKDIQNYVKEYLANLTELMGLSVTFETKLREEQIYIKMYSDNNSILIGKDGKTLSALLTIVKQMLNTNYNINPKIILDVENYKENQEKRIERLAKKLAREVVKTKIDIKMDNMNSYERRIVHSILSNDNKVCTVSEGEEPNRHVVIKLKS